MHCIRRIISEKISEIARQTNVYYELEVVAKKQQNGKNPILHWTPEAGKTPEDVMHLIPTLEFDKELVQSVRLLSKDGRNPARIEFQLNSQSFAEDTLLPMKVDTKAASKLSRQHMVMEFSSPNIAKPFHVGHLRSTIIGNVLANVHQQLGYRVTKLNYLGDWGTQFGMLQVGVEMQGVSEEQMQRKPIETLYRAYVAANEASKTDETVKEKARQYFTELETGTNKEMAQQWTKYRHYTIAELEQIYSRLGVHFDQYDWESQYSQRDIQNILRNLEEKSLLHDEHDGRKIVQVDDRRVPIIKSDGSTLYLARDIAALVDRHQRFSFDRIFYVVDNGQTDHFNACFKTTAALCEEIGIDKLKHVKFGRIHGMSTRSGNVVFLRDVLDEARDIMLERQLKSPTTKVELSTDSYDFKTVADVLGVSAVIINDLKQRRQRDYDFDWNKVLQVNGDTGIKLQYTHCRLFNLLENVADINVEGIKPSMEHLAESEAQDLLYEIARFEQVVWWTKEQLEACILVNYLFALCNSTSRALKRLNVKNESCLSKQQNRILLFTSARRTLNKGMQILGLSPLNKM